MKFGRKPRRHDPRIHVRKLGFFGMPPWYPPSIHYGDHVPDALGMLLNDKLGDCTCAGMLHAQQIWTAVANPPMATVTDADALAAYETACQYNPNDPSTDQGGDEQSVLTYWLNNAVAGNKLTAFYEVEAKNLDDIRATINDCAVAYLGFDVPAYLEGALQKPGATWDVQTENGGIIGGHCVILVGYDASANTFDVISWGAKYTMTGAFLQKFNDEAYALIDSQWIEATGSTPAGMDLAQLESSMGALRI